jgi:hypothetical protein
MSGVVKGNVMSKRTISEIYFEKLCLDRGIACERIPESDARTADYRVVIDSAELITEVKQLDPNREDERLREIWDTPQSPGAFDATKRVRKALTDGYPQIKRLSERTLSAMIVIYNNAGEWNLLNGFAITTAMFGDYGFVFESKPDQSIEVTRHGHPGKRRVTEDAFRSLSAVSVLECTGPGELRLHCYHNPFAEVPIEPSLLAKLASDQYVKRNPHQGAYVSWKPRRIET